MPGQREFSTASSLRDRDVVGAQTVPVRGVKILPLLSIFLATFLVASRSHAGRTFDFEFHDEEYLFGNQHGGGRVYVPKDVNGDEPVPLVVFLHGVNRLNQVHMWLGTGPDDLRARLDDGIRSGDLPPVILAGPSQTRLAAWAGTLWTGLDLEEFVSATESAIGGRARIARDRVIVAGHSGAGCNLEGGLLKIAADRGSIEPMGIVALDTCLDDAVGRALGRASESTRVATYWQSIFWNRKLADFAIGFSLTRSEGWPGTDWFERVDPKGRWPHDAMVAPSFVKAVSFLAGPPETREAEPQETAIDDRALGP